MLDTSFFTDANSKLRSSDFRFKVLGPRIQELRPGCEVPVVDTENISCYAEDRKRKDYYDSLE